MCIRDSMNVRFYAVNAFAATKTVIDSLSGWEGPGHRVDTVYTRHHREQLLGTALEVRSGVLDATRDSMRVHHELRATETDTLAATFVHTVVATDDRSRHVPIGTDAVAAAHAERMELPDYAATRSIDLDTDPHATAPSLDVVRARGLAMRQEREVTAEECDADGRYRPEMVPMLTWGGEPLAGQEGEMLHETEDGRLMAWASMETRVHVARLPARGDRVQSFGAGVAVHDKVTHRMLWSFDVGSGDLLTAFEAVSMAFDIRARRPMSIPDWYRTREVERIEPDLVPSPAGIQAGAGTAST